METRFEVSASNVIVHQVADGGSEVFAAPSASKDEEEQFEQPRARSNTMPSVESEETEDGVILRVPSGPRQDPDKRKSGTLMNNALAENFY